MRKGNQYETTVLGKEPLWSDIQTLTDMEILCRVGKAINWYNYFCSDEDYKNFVVEYCKNNSRITKDTLAQIKSIKKNNKVFRDIGSICRIKTLGGKVSSKDEEYFNNNFESLLEIANTTEIIEDTPKSRPTVRDHIQGKISETIGNLEYKIDEFLECSDYKVFLKTFNMKSWISSNNLKSYECEAIRDHYSEVIKEKKEALEGRDPQLKEAYEYLGKIKLRKFVELLEEIISISGQYSAKKVRKPRKKKKKSPEQLIKKLNYKRDDTSLGLTSIDPRDIIGASKLVVFNTKYSKICVYETQSADGLSVKGTTLQNVDKAICKTVRKPKEFFKTLGNGIRSFNNQFSKLKTKESEASLRIGEHSIIVKAF